jgi:hypothetical protein
LWFPFKGKGSEFRLPGILLRIPVLDHIIITETEKYYSLKEHGDMEKKSEKGSRKFSLVVLLFYPSLIFNLLNISKVFI